MMTVKQLIEALQKMPPDLPVQIVMADNHHHVRLLERVDYQGSYILLRGALSSW